MQNNDDQKISYFQSITELMQAGINLINKDGMIIYVNEAYCKMHYYTKEELVGKYLDMILPEQSPVDGLERYKKIINKEINLPFIVEGMNIRKDGTRFPVLISWNYLILNDEIEGMVSVVQDLSQIKKVETALKESEKKYRSLVENISDFIWEIDEKGEYIYVSPKCKELFFYNPEDMIGRKLWDFLINNENADKIKKCFDDRVQFNHMELMIKNNYNNITLVESSGIPLFDKHKFLGFRGVDRDINLKKKVEKIDMEMKNLKDKLEKKEYLEYIMGDSDNIRQVHYSVEKVGKTDFSVIIYGETGTGKEIIANSIHNFSNRNNKPMISIDCGAIPESIIESELFGYVKGAFTGAADTKNGAFQMANGGTIFLDEITNLSFEMQKKLLRVLQEKEVKKVGSTQTEKLDIRVIAASNENIIDMVDKAKFRKDLFFRLNEFSISIPPLRDRKDDIILLAQRFVKEISQRLNIKSKKISREAVQLLLDYNWPGNVRELKNVIKKAIIISEDEIKPEHLDLISEKNKNSNEYKITEINEIDNLEKIDLKDITGKYIEKIEREIIKKCLIKFDNNKSKTSKYLNIDYKTLLTKIKEYKL